MPATVRIPPLKEADITKQIKGFLESRRWTGFRLQSGLVRGYTGNTFIRLNKSGTPDWIFVRGSDCLFVEMKAPGKEPSQKQEEWHRWASMNGILSIWADGLGDFMLKYERRFPG